MMAVDDAPLRVVTCDEWWDEHLATDATVLLDEAVAEGAALGWVDPPDAQEVESLLGALKDASAHRDACLVFALTDANVLVGLGYWRRYSRPTHWPHADLERVVVSRAWRSRGIGRAMLARLLLEARRANLEQMTLDVRGDQVGPIELYRSLGFTEYGRLRDFVAVHELRYDKVFFKLNLRDT